MKLSLLQQSYFPRRSSSFRSSSSSPPDAISASTDGLTTPTSLPPRTYSGSSSTASAASSASSLASASPASSSSSSSPPPPPPPSTPPPLSPPPPPHPPTPYDLTWLVIEAGGVSNETASILDRSQLNYIHISFHEGEMPREWAERHRMEARMRLQALRVVRERRMEVFADDSNIHSTELFDEIQKVKWMGTVSVGSLSHSGVSEHSEGENEDLLVPIQGPDCSHPLKKKCNL